MFRILSVSPTKSVHCLIYNLGIFTVKLSDPHWNLPMMFYFAVRQTLNLFSEDNSAAIWKNTQVFLSRKIRLGPQQSNT